MQNRIHGILSDVVFECRGLEGIPRRRTGTWSRSGSWSGESIEGMTPTVVVPAMLSFRSTATD